MTSIGQFGAVRPPLDLSFEWCGQATIRVNPASTDLTLTEFMQTAGEVSIPDLDENSTPAEMAQAVNSLQVVTAMLSKFLREQIHPDDWDLFWSIAKRSGQTNADLMALSRALAAAVTEARTDFPTGPPSVSTPMPARPVGSSGGALSRQERRQQMRAAARAGRKLTRREVIVARSMEEFPQRPDLRLMLWQQERDRAEAEAADAAAASFRSA